MIEIAIVAVTAAVALGAGWLAQRHRPAPPPVTTHIVPQQLDRADFTRAEAPWLVVVFTSDTCSTCARVWQATEALESDDVAIQNVEAVRDAGLHERYGITAVPSVVIADAAGVCRDSFLGPPSASDLWAAVAAVRESA